MSRRIALTVLVPALIGTMVGVGMAAFRPSERQVVGVEESSSPPVPGSDAPSIPPSRSPSPSPTVERIDPLPTPPASPTPSPTPSPEPTATPGPGYDVAAVQQRLTDLKYYVGAIDGKAGPATVSAVMAFQKVNGLGADGVVGPLTQAALDNPVTPTLRGGPGTRIEVELSAQVLYFVQGGELSRIMPVSSGSGQSYTTASGGTARSLTPVGTFTIERRISGVREANLGTLYDPMYFYRGWAIHGSNSVPAYPASHGCVRLTRSDALWLFDRAPVGTAVSLYGGTHVFTPGSGAAGTDTPAGDTPADTPPAETPAPPPPPTTPPPAPAPTTPPPTTPPATPPPTEETPPTETPPTTPAPTAPEATTPAPEATTPAPAATPTDLEPTATGT